MYYINKCHPLNTGCIWNDYKNKYYDPLKTIYHEEKYNSQLNNNSSNLYYDDWQFNDSIVILPPNIFKIKNQDKLDERYHNGLEVFIPEYVYEDVNVYKIGDYRRIKRYYLKIGDNKYRSLNIRKEDDKDIYDPIPKAFKLKRIDILKGGKKIKNKTKRLNKINKTKKNLKKYNKSRKNVKNVKKLHKKK